MNIYRWIGLVFVLSIAWGVVLALWDERREKKNDK